MYGGEDSCISEINHKAPLHIPAPPSDIPQYEWLLWIKIDNTVFL